jgi:hypothetical protein
MRVFQPNRSAIGYHGCDESLVTEVLSGKTKLIKSAKRYDWLGAGVYFWENGFNRAQDGAKARASEPGHAVKKPAVLGAIINLGRCLDLLDTEATDLLAGLYPMFEKAITAKGAEMPKNASPKVGSVNPNDLVLRFLDCAVINWALDELAKDGEKFDTVRCVYSEGLPCFDGSKIMAQSHIQLVVRNTEVITGYFKPNVD